MGSNSFSHTTLVNSEPYIELNNQGLVKRYPLKQGQHRLGRDNGWADLVVPSDWLVISNHHAILRKEDGEYRIYDGDDEQNPSSNGLFVNKTRITTQRGYLLEDGIQLEIGQNPQNYILFTYTNPSTNSQIAPLSVGKRQLDLGKLQHWPVELGRDPSQTYSSIKLDSPTISRLHAIITKNQSGPGYLITDHSTNGTFVNGQRANSKILLNNGDTLRIGPFALLLQQDILELFDPGSHIRLDAYELVRKVKDRQGKERTILNRVSLPIEPGQLIALVGSSGTGKSTLLKSLLGIQPIDEGSVFLNGDSLHQNFDLYRSQVGYVPQDDIIHQNLSVEEVLTYACQLRLPPETPVKQLVLATLQQVRLDSVRQTAVCNLSGGQRKRVNIGVELLANPRLFFLDEPTSGLDPGLDKEIMLLLRELANQGRTIILVTHATANIEECDRVAFLGQGGNLCFFGPPTEAMNFFQMPSQELKYFSDIYIKLDRGKTFVEVQQNVNSWVSKFYQSHFYQSYVQGALSPVSANRPLSLRKSALTSYSHDKVYFLHQIKLLNSRYLKLVLRDRLSLLLNLLTAPLGLSLIALTLRNETPLAKLSTQDITQAPLALRVLFVFTCASILAGLLGSVQEIVKESAIYARERLINLQPSTYLGSKLLVRTGFALIQTILITGVILLGFKSPESKFIPWLIGAGITTFLTILSTIAMGLMVSTFVKNEGQANNSISLIFLPQIILSGVLFKLDGISQWFSWFMISRWSIGAYGSLVDINAMIPALPYLSKLPLDPSRVYTPTWENLILNWFALCIHTGVYLVTALWLKQRQDILN